MTTPDAAMIRREAEAAFAKSLRPLHKRAFGVAVGVGAATLIFVLTAVPLLRSDHTVPLWLLSEYFTGYEENWRGAVIGAAWGAFAGFVMGWFFAFCRNVLVGLHLMIIRSRADLARARDLLDHI